MALRLTGNTLTSIIYNSSKSVIPSFFNIQVRHRKRKGYREKADALKRKAKLEKLRKAPPPVVEKNFLFKSKLKKIEKTIEPNKPDPPLDDVFISENFKPVKYSLIDAINFHKEYHHPTIYNNPDAYIEVLMEFDMTGKKITQVLNPFKGIATIPHPFSLGGVRDVLVLCGPEDVSDAVAAGAQTCGGKDLVKKIKEGVIQLSTYEYILCHVDFLSELTPIRNMLKLRMPRLSAGTVTADLPSAIKKFMHGIEYQCIKPDSAGKFGIVSCKVGTIDMKAQHIEGNFKALLEDVQRFKPPREGDFVTYISCSSPPSPEQFAIDLSLYLKKEESKDDVEEEEEEEEYDEKKKLRKFQKKLEVELAEGKV